MARGDMSFSAARVTHLPPLCDRAYRRNCNVSATEVRQLCIDSSTGGAPRRRPGTGTAGTDAIGTGTAGTDAIGTATVATDTIGTGAAVAETGRSRRRGSPVTDGGARASDRRSAREH